MIRITLKQLVIAAFWISYIIVGYVTFTIEPGSIANNFFGTLLMLYTGIAAIATMMFVIGVLVGEIEWEWKINLPKFTRNTEKDELLQQLGKAHQSGNKQKQEEIYQILEQKNYL